MEQEIQKRLLEFMEEHKLIHLNNEISELMVECYKAGFIYGRKHG